MPGRASETPGSRAPHAPDPRRGSDDFPMRPRIPGVFACLVFSLAAILPFEPWGLSGLSSCSLEVRVESDQSGLVQLYYDVGRDFNETDSVVEPVVAGHPSLLRFALPSATYKALRFDPLDRAARMTISGAKIVDGSGRTVLALAPEQFAKSNQIDSLKIRDERLFIETSPGGYDPQLSVKLANPFRLTGPPWWKRAALVFAAMLGGLVVASWACSERVRLGARARSLWNASVASPGWAVLAAALLGTVAANYPIVFAGRSIVTPNLGVPLLYGENPWIPGFQNVEVGDPHKSDVAALMWHHLPLSMLERRALFRDGELPLWNRYDSAGSPLLGQGQSCFGDPLNLLPILADGAAWAWDLKFLLAKWIFAMGIGLCAWRSSRHLPASLLMAASAPFFGFFLYRINHPATFSFCYAPWILYCWLRCLDGRSARSATIWLAALVGANWAELNSGTVKEAYVLILSMNFSGLCLLLASKRPLPEKSGLVAGALASGAIFAMVGSPVWYTFYRALRGSYTSYNSPFAFQIQPGMLIGLFDEAFYRPFQVELGVVNPSANFFVLIGLLWAVVRWRSLAAERVAVALALSSVPLLALAFGLVPPGLIERIPFLGNILHIDNTFSCALIIIFSVLAAMGWREALERLGSRDGKREAVTVCLLVLALFAAYLGTAQAILRGAYSDSTWGRIIAVPPFIHAYGWSLVAAAAVFLWALHRARQRGSPSAAILIYLALAFAAFHWREGLLLGSAYSDYVVTPTGRVDLQARSPTIDAVLAAGDSPSRVIGFHNSLLPGWSIAYDLEGISGPDALVNRYYRELMDTAGVRRLWDWRYIVEGEDLPRLKPVFDFLNVRFYIGYRLDKTWPDKKLKFLLSSYMDAYESATAWPRAFFSDSAAVYNDAAQYCSWIKAGDGRPFVGIQHSDWIRLTPLPRVSGDLNARKINAAEDYRLTTNTTSFTVSATGPGFIVLSEAYEPGNFRVTVNGKESPYLRVNHAFKGVYVDAAGTYRVEFAYWPRGLSTTLALFAAGVGLTALALLAAIFVLKPASGPSRGPA